MFLTLALRPALAGGVNILPALWAVSIAASVFVADPYCILLSAVDVPGLLPIVCTRDVAPGREDAGDRAVRP